MNPLHFLKTMAMTVLYCAELEAEGGEPELVEQLSGQLAADSRAVLEV